MEWKVGFWVHFPPGRILGALPACQNGERAKSIAYRQINRAGGVESNHANRRNVDFKPSSEAALDREDVPVRNRCCKS
jgi:hypothetical protein